MKTLRHTTSTRTLAGNTWHENAVAGDREENYWDTAVELDDFSVHHKSWRAYSDELGAAWITRWLDGSTAERVLKTDLFDEAVSPGLIPHIRDRAVRVFGIDVAQEIAGLAQRRNPKLIVLRCDVRNLPYASDTFDAVVSPSTLDHFRDASDIADAVAELARVLRPGGRLIVSFDNLDNPVVRLRNALPFAFLKRIGLVPYFIGATLNREQLISVLHTAGFEVVETRAVLHCPRAPVVAILRLLDKLGASRSAERVIRACRVFERLERLGSAYRTGNYVAALAIKH
jgi:SAM-dependent methyltransferase